MNRNLYVDVCKTTQTGKPASVRNMASNEVGIVASCTHEHLLVKTSEGKEKCWDYHKCEPNTRS